MKALIILIKGIFVLSLAFATAEKVSAHEQSVARILMHIDGTKNNITWQVGLKDINRVINIDENNDLSITWSEVKNNRTKLQALINDNIKLYSNSENCKVTLKNIDLKTLSNGNALLLSAEVNCLHSVDSVKYQFLRGLDSLHIAELTVISSEQKQLFLLNSQSSSVALKDNGQKQTTVSFFEFIKQGIIHIWIGLDHLAFLVILLLSSMSLNTTTKASSRATSTPKLAKLHKSSLQLLAFVTAFTIAHSLTLISASLNWIYLPSWLVESAIAASVAWGAFRLLFSKSVIGTATVFNFGLIHGLGFASVLADLTGDISDNVLLLLGFNIGVEIGQLTFLAIAYLIVHFVKYILKVRFIEIGLTIPIGIISIVWMIERLAEQNFFVD